jgi:hypothetical protein
MKEQRSPRKDDWILTEDISSPPDKVKLEELLALLDVKMIEFSPSGNGNNRCMLHLEGPEHLVEGLKVILKPGITF